ncbi:MAG: DUF805 domain-containing protein [Candidatus Dactylopiibacterium sp.]|nr:DUF805 domain-containing protein [Candidatus Dactylopiibacterium sp.]
MSGIFPRLRRRAALPGRLSRREFWPFLAWHALLLFVLRRLGDMLGAASPARLPAHPAGWLVAVFCLASLPTLAGLCVRRLHDAGRSGGWVFAQVVPVVGTLVLLALLALPGQPPEPGETEAGRPGEALRERTRHGTD